MVPHTGLVWPQVFYVFSYVVCQHNGMFRFACIFPFISAQTLRIIEVFCHAMALRRSSTVLALVSFHFTGLPFSRLVGHYPQVHCSTHRGSGSWCRRAMASNRLYLAMLKRCEDWLADPFADEEGEEFDIEEFIAQVSEYVESVESGEEVLKARLVPGPFWWKTFCFVCWWCWWLPNSKSPAHWEVLLFWVAGTFHSCKVTAVTLYNVQCAEMSDAAEVSLQCPEGHESLVKSTSSYFWTWRSLQYCLPTLDVAFDW